MQPLDRDGLSAAETVALVESVDADTGFGVDLLDADLSFVRALEVEAAGSNVVYTADQAIRHRCTLVLAEPVQWQLARLRPWATLTHAGRTFRADLGVYRPSLPELEAGDDPLRWQVNGYGLTVDLNRPHGATVRIRQGESYLDVAQSLCESRGLVVRFTGAGDAPVASRDRIWPLDRSTTTLQIVNDLLAEAGFEKVWMRWDGVLRAKPARDPAERGSEWRYDAQHPRTSVGPHRRLESNWLDVPNQLVAIASAATAWNPVTNDGIHVVEDPDSIAVEGLRSEVETLDAANQTQLIAAAERRFKELTRRVDRISFNTLPNPLHWHDDVIRLTDVDLTNRRALVTDWTYNGDGGQTEVAGTAL